MTQSQVIERMRDILDDAMLTLESDDIYPEWIPLTEREPDGDGRVLVSFDDGYVAIVDYVDGDFHLWSHLGEPLAWMPLPEGYDVRKDN